LKKILREQVWVGTFVIVAAVILIGVVLSVSGAFGEKGVVYHAYFKYAAGLAPAAPVRYGGFLAGKIEHLGVDPSDSTRIRIDFSVRPDIPVKTDSTAKISAIGALGESYLEITTGTKDAKRLPPGSELNAKEMVALADLGDQISSMVPTANQVLQSLNARLNEMQVTIAQVNDLLGEPNRKNISSSLVSLNGMLAETRPKVAVTLANVQKATEQMDPILKNVQTATDRLPVLLEDVKAAIKQANATLANLDGILTENRPDIKASMAETRKTLDSASQMVDLLKATMEKNTDNLDDTLINIREATDNLKEMSDTLKRKPSVLIRGETSKDRVPGSTK